MDLYKLITKVNEMWFPLFTFLGFYLAFSGIFKYINEEISIIGVFLILILGLIFSIIGFCFRFSIALDKNEKLLKQILDNQNKQGGKK